MQPFITVLGDINVDLTFSSTALPRSGDDIAASAVHWGAGGAALNSAAAAARLGAAVRLIGRVGRDPAADLALAAAAAVGIDCAAVQIDDVRATGLCAVLVTPGGERSFISYRGANLACDSSVDPAPSLRNAQLLYVGGHALLDGSQREAALLTMQHAVDQAVPIALDLCLPLVRSAPALIERLLPQLWLITLNDDEAVALRPGLSVEEMLYDLAGYGAVQPVIKRGALGCSIIDRESCWSVPAPAVNAVDTTACGDAFSIAYAWSLLRGTSALDAARIANTVGALTATRPGAVAALPDRAEIVAHLDLRLRSIFSQ